MPAGRVAELWRYPVKSMRGERRDRVEVLDGYGVPGDRGWGVRDEALGEIRGAKKITRLVQFAARYLDEPSGSATPPIEVTFPDDSRMTSEETGVDAALSTALDREVRLWPRRPEGQRQHGYRTKPIGDREMRAQLDLRPDQSVPDFSELKHALEEQRKRFVAPLGTYFDAFPLSLLTSASMATLSQETPESTIDSRRFRKNIIVASDAKLEGFPEFDWIGRRLRVGSVVGEVVGPIPRCIMVGLPQDDLPRDRAILRSLVHAADMNFGVYLTVVEQGEITEGDAVEVVA